MEPEEENLALLRAQVVAKLTHENARMWERRQSHPNGLASLFTDTAALETYRKQRLEANIEETIPFAVEVWEEGGRQLPLTDGQLATISIRHSQSKCEELTNKMVDGVSSLPPDRQRLVGAVAAMFKQQNEQMAQFRNVGDMSENDMQRMAEQMAGGLQEMTERMKRGDFNSEEDKA